MSDSRDIHLLFHVPEGLEFIAAKDIEESLDNDTLLQNTKYSWEKKTGRVHLFCSVSSLNLFRDYIMNQVTLLCIYSVTLVASESIIPADIFSDVQPTYDYIMEQTRRAPWNTVIDEDPKDSNEDKKSFRATFRKEQIKHKAKSQEIAGYIGSAFNDFYSYWKVKMTDYTYEIMSIWFQSTDTGVLSRVEGREESIILLLGVTIPLKDQRQRNRVFVGRTSLNPCIAYCLAKLADPKPGQVIFDMCCGTGTIPIEGASKFKDVFWLGSEIKLRTLTEKALGNLLHCKINNVDLMLGDGRKICFRSGVVDTIVSDWPWGLRENSYSQIQKLYPKFVKQMWNILRTNGKAYIVTQGHNLMNRILKYDWCQQLWTLNEIISIGIGGHDVSIYILTKNPNPESIPKGVI